MAGKFETSTEDNLRDRLRAENQRANLAEAWLAEATALIRVAAEEFEYRSCGDAFRSFLASLEKKP